MNNRVLQLDPRDNVLIALSNLSKGETVTFGGQSYALGSDVRAKHKFATQDLPVGADVVMYGVLVGKAMQPIRQGELLTIRNLHHEAAEFHEKTRGIPLESARCIAMEGKRSFQDIARSDGQVGTRNYWLVVPLVFCENRNIGVLKQAFEEELGFAAPQIYRRQVAELARLYQRRPTAELKSCALPGNEASPLRSTAFREY